MRTKEILELDLNGELTRMFYRTIVLLAGLLASSMTYANGVDFRISSETAELTLLSEASTFGYGGADIGIGVFIDEIDDVIASGSMLVSGTSTGDVRAMQFGVGVKAFLGSIDASNETGGALAIGIRGRYVFPGQNPLAVVAEAFVAPGVTSLVDFQGVTEMRLGIEMEVSPSARAYVGYHALDIETEKSLVDLTLDDTVHFGVRFSY